MTKMIKNFQSLPMELVRHIIKYSRPTYPYVDEMRIMLKYREVLRQKAPKIFYKIMSVTRYCGYRHKNKYIIKLI